MRTKEELKELLQDYNGQYEVYELYQEAIQEQGLIDKEIFTMDSFLDFIEETETSTTNAINRMFYGDFNPNHDWARFNGYGNYESTMFIDEFIDLDIIMEYLEGSKDNE